jgi:hypothetical protein
MSDTTTISMTMDEDASVGNGSGGGGSGGGGCGGNGLLKVDFNSKELTEALAATLADTASDATVVAEDGVSGEVSTVSSSSSSKKESVPQSSRLSLAVPTWMWCPISNKLLLNAAVAVADQKIYDYDTIISSYNNSSSATVVKVPLVSTEVQRWVDEHKMLTPEQFVDALVSGDVELLQKRPHPLPCVSRIDGCIGMSAVQIAAGQSQWPVLVWLLSLRNASTMVPVTLGAVSAAVAARCTKQPNWMSDSTVVAAYLSGVQMLIDNLDSTETILSAAGAAVVVEAIRTGCVDVVRRLHSAGFPFAPEYHIQPGLVTCCESVPMTEFLFTTAGLNVADGNYRCLVESVAVPTVWNHLWKKALNSGHTEITQKVDLLQIMMLASFGKPKVETIKALLNVSSVLKTACANPENANWNIIIPPQTYNNKTKASTSAASSSTSSSSDGKNKSNLVVGGLLDMETSSALVRLVLELREQNVESWWTDAELNEAIACARVLVAEGGTPVSFQSKPSGNTALHFALLPMAGDRPILPFKFILALAELRAKTEIGTNVWEIQNADEETAYSLIQSTGYSIPLFRAFADRLATDAKETKIKVQTAFKNGVLAAEQHFHKAMAVATKLPSTDALDETIDQMNPSSIDPPPPHTITTSGSSNSSSSSNTTTYPNHRINNMPTPSSTNNGATNGTTAKKINVDKSLKPAGNNNNNHNNTAPQQPLRTNRLINADASTTTTTATATSATATATTAEKAAEKEKESTTLATTTTVMPTQTKSGKPSTRKGGNKRKPTVATSSSAAAATISTATDTSTTSGSTTGSNSIPEDSNPPPNKKPRNADTPTL